MYNIKKNNYYEREKVSTIYTPIIVSEFIKGILEDHIEQGGIIFDPCVGGGNLLRPWEQDYQVVGFDVIDQEYPNTRVHDYLTLTPEEIDFVPDLVLINPPFNVNDELKTSAKELGFNARPLIPEVFLFKTLQLFGPDTKIVLFTPYGLRLNVDRRSQRLMKFLRNEYPEICSIISLPKDIYDGYNVKFHSEILLFNIPNIRPHYFLDTRRNDE